MAGPLETVVRQMFAAFDRKNFRDALRVSSSTSSAKTPMGNGVWPGWLSAQTMNKVFVQRQLQRPIGKSPSARNLKARRRR